MRSALRTQPEARDTMLPEEIQLASPIEDVVNAFPHTVTWLIEAHRIRVIRCGAPIWATVGELAEMHGLEPDAFLAEIRSSASVSG